MPKKSIARRQVVVPDIPAERRARWHLICARAALAEAYAAARHKGRKATRHLTNAHDVALHLWLALAENASPEDRRRLNRMATSARVRLTVERSDVERQVTERLPPDVETARDQFSFDKLGDEQASRNLAWFVLLSLASHAHADSARIRRRWQIPDGPIMGDVLSNEHFRQDLEELAADVRALMLEPPNGSLSKAIVKAAYRTLGLGEAFEAESAKRRRMR